MSNPNETPFNAAEALAEPRTEIASLPSVSQANPAGATPESVLETLLKNPSIDLFQNDPASVQLIREMMKEIDTEDLMALSKYGSDAMETMSSTALEIFARFQDDGLADPTPELLKTQTAFQERLTRLQEELQLSEASRVQNIQKQYKVSDARMRMLNDPSSPSLPAPSQRAVIMETVGKISQATLAPMKKFYAAITDPSGRKAREKEIESWKIDAQIISALLQGQDDDSQKILEMCQQSAEDFLKLQHILMANRNKPHLIFEQMQTAKEAAIDARTISILRLVAMAEKRKETEEKIHALQEKGGAQNLSLEEIDELERLDETRKIMMRREEQFCLTGTLAIGQINHANMALRYACDAEVEQNTQREQVLGVIATAVMNLKAQHELKIFFTRSSAGYRMQRIALESQGKGAELLLAAKRKADLALLEARTAIIETGEATLKAIEGFRRQEATQQEAMRESRELLAAGAAKMAGAARKNQEEDMERLLGRRPNAAPASVASRLPTGSEEPHRTGSSVTDRLKELRRKALNNEP